MPKEKCCKGSVPIKGVLILAATGDKQIQTSGPQEPARLLPKPDVLFGIL